MRCSEVVCIWSLTGPSARRNFLAANRLARARAQTHKVGQEGATCDRDRMGQIGYKRRTSRESMQSRRLLALDTVLGLALLAPFRGLVGSVVLVLVGLLLGLVDGRRVVLGRGVD